MRFWLHFVGDFACCGCDGVDLGKTQGSRTLERRCGQFIGLDLGGKRRAIGVVFEDRVRILALGQGRERFALLVEGRNAALVADGNRFQDIAILIGRERQRMADARKTA